MYDNIGVLKMPNVVRTRSGGIVPAMDTLHTLPQELTDHIIDLLAVNLTSTAARKNFANYTLVCRAWTPHASQCLLKHIEVLASELPTFLDSIRSSKRFQTYTEELCILGAANMSIHWDSAFQALPHLCSLELWSNMLPRNEFSLLPNPTSTRKYRLAKLKIYCVELASIPFLLLPFSHVDILELRSLEAEPPEDGASDSYTGAMLDHQIQGSFPLTVNRLVLDDCCQKNALARLQLLLRPTALFANGFDRQEVSGISAFLLHTRESVEHINLLATQDDAPGYQIHVQNWSKCFNLNAALLLTLSASDSGSLVDLKVLARCPKLTSITLDLVDVLVSRLLLKTTYCRST